MAAKNKIGPIQKGALHQELGIAKDKKIPVSTLRHELAVAKEKHDVKLERRILFDLNFAHKSGS